MNKVALARSTVASFRSGDPSAFEAVVRAHLSLVRTIVGRYFHQVFEQEEAVQEVWLQVLRQRGLFDVDRWEQIDRWIAVLAKRRCIDLVRKKGREPRSEELSSVEASAAAATSADQDAGLESSDIREALELFAATLEGQWKEFFELHFLRGRTHPETARELDVPVARSKYMKRVLVARARRSRPLMNVLGRSVPGRAPGVDENAS